MSLRWENVTENEIVLPKNITKKKTRTRSIPTNPRLWAELMLWRDRQCTTHGREPDRSELVFPNARDPSRHMSRQAIDKALRGACAELGVAGASTHSLRRSALTAASDKGVPLRVLQSISGHRSLDTLQRYLDVKDEAKREAALAFA